MIFTVLLTTRQHRCYFCNDASRKIYYTTNTWYRDLHRNCLYRFLFQTNCSEAFPWVAEKVVAPYRSSFHAFQDTKELVLIKPLALKMLNKCFSMQILWIGQVFLSKSLSNALTVALPISTIMQYIEILNSLNLTGQRIYAHDKIIRLRDFLQGISSEEINPV